MSKKPESQALQASDEQQTNGAGRPTMFDAAVADVILNRLASGETLTSICRRSYMPHQQTVYRWRRKFPEFARDYLRAREDWAESQVDEMLAIADDSTLDEVEKTGRNGATYTAVDHENIQRSKLRVDTRWRVIQAVNAVYANKQDVTVTGTVQHEHTVTSLSDREKMRRLALFMLEDQRDTAIEGELATDSPEPVSPASDAG